MAVAAGSIQAQYLFLFPSQWGLADAGRNAPYDGFTSTSAGHNVTTPTFYRPGQIIRVWDATSGGECEFMYAKLNSQGATTGLAALGMLAQTELHDTNQTEPFYNLTTDKSKNSAYTTGRAAVCLSAMTTGNYGWFWVGGHCPQSYISGLATTAVLVYSETGGVIPQGPVCLADDTGNGLALAVGSAAGVRAVGLISRVSTAT